MPLLFALALFIYFRGRRFVLTKRNDPIYITSPQAPLSGAILTRALQNERRSTPKQ